MLEKQNNQHENKKFEVPNNNTNIVYANTFKSPYFASVRRHGNNYNREREKDRGKNCGGQQAKNKKTEEHEQAVKQQKITKKQNNQCKIEENQNYLQNAKPINRHKIKKSVQNAITITKYNGVVNDSQSSSNRIFFQPVSNPHQTAFKTPNQIVTKKKTFNRFNKFQQISNIYTTNVPSSTSFPSHSSHILPYSYPQRQEKISKAQKTQKKEKFCENYYAYLPIKLTQSRSNSRDKISIKSQKTLALLQKYRSYKQIGKQEKEGKRRERQRINSNFRMKTKSGNSLQLGQKEEKDVGNQYRTREEQKNQIKKEKQRQKQDWLCKQLIANEVYGVYDDQFY